MIKREVGGRVDVQSRDVLCYLPTKTRDKSWKYSKKHNMYNFLTDVVWRLEGCFGSVIHLYKEREALKAKRRTSWRGVVVWVWGWF